MCALICGFWKGEGRGAGRREGSRDIIWKEKGR